MQDITATTTAETATVIPTICLDAESHRQIVADVRRACTECGFFYVTGHTIQTQPILEQSRSFFALPDDQKRAVRDPTLTRGYTAMQEETLDPIHQSEGDTKEGFYISINDIPTNDPRYNPAKLTGPNQWPSKETTPDLKDPQEWKLVMEMYMQDATILCRTIVQLLAESLNLSPDHFDHAFHDLPLATLRLLHYTSTISQPEMGLYACGAHSDYGMLTLLLTDEVSGLEIMDLRTQQWVQVPSRKDHFVVNLGDMLERWTNGMYRSTMHRVVNRNGKERYSIPYFFEPSFDTIVECLPCCCNDDNPAKWPPTTSGQHLLSKYTQTHADYKSSQS